MWKKPDFLLIAAVTGVIGASCFGAGYILVLSTRPAEHIQASSPAPTGLELTSNPAGITDETSSTARDSGPTLPLAASPPDVSEALIPNGPAPQRPPLVDHRYDGVITPVEIARIKGSLRLSRDQEPQWRVLAAAFQEAGDQQRGRIDSGQPLDPAFKERVLAALIPSASPLIQTLRGDQIKSAGTLSRALGFINVSAMMAGAGVPAAPVAAKPKPEPPVAVTPTLPPVAKAPLLTSHRYEGLLTAAEINRIKLSLKLRPEQEAYWPAVEAILRELGQQQMAQVDAGQQIDVTMSGGMAQRFYSAASPLLQTLTEEQKAEVRRRARMMGLEAYASYL